MIPVVALIIVACASLIIIRIGAAALEFTGLSHDAARFQALSAFFGAGFTTRESELVVDHPVRRRIIRDLIVVGQLGVMFFLASAVITFTRVSPGSTRLIQAGVLLIALVFLWGLSKTPAFMRLLDRTVKATLKRSGAVRALDYEKLLAVHKGYVVSEVTVEPDHPIAGKSLGELAMRRRGVVVLGVTGASGDYFGAPKGDTVIKPGDTLTVYAIERDARKLAEGKLDAD